MRVEQWCSCRPVCTLRHSPQWWLRSHELRDSQCWPCSRPEVKLKMVWIDFYFIAKKHFFLSMKTCLALNSQSSSRRVSEVLLPGLTDQSQISLVCNEKYFLGLKLWNIYKVWNFEIFLPFLLLIIEPGSFSSGPMAQPRLGTELQNRNFWVLSFL